MDKIVVGRRLTEDNVRRMPDYDADGVFGFMRILSMLGYNLLIRY